MKRTQSSGWVLVLGEDENDRLVIRSFCEKLCPSMRGRIKTLAKPVPRLRDAHSSDLVERARDVAAAVAAESVGKNVICVLVHEDLDSINAQSFDSVRAKVQAALESAFAEFGLTTHVAATVAVEETEAWLLLFPDVLHGFRKHWEVPVKLRGIDTGRQQNPKAVLKTISRRAAHPYRERDAPAIAARIAAGQYRPEGMNASWSHFVSQVGIVCA